MLKKILIYSIAIIAAGYIAFSLLFITRKEEGEVCKEVRISICDGENGALSSESIEALLKSNNLLPNGKLMNDINCSEIENFISKLSIVKECQSYKTHKGYIGIDIDCKVPIMQIFDINGRNFYIDAEGNIIEDIHNTVYLPVASGHIEREMAKNELLVIARFLQDNRFWNEQIEQIYFNSQKEIVIVPRIGNHTIEMGKIDNIEKKLEKLKTFYKKGLNTIGWNKYKKINIEFDKQVICTKRE